MQVIIKVKGLTQVQKDLAQFPEKAKSVYDNAIQQAGREFRDFTKTLPPVSVRTTGYDAKGMPTDIGNMASRITKRKIQALAAGVVGGAHYSGYVHEGTRKMRARPYFEWSLELGGLTKIDDILKRASKLIP